MFWGFSSINSKAQVNTKALEREWGQVGVSVFGHFSRRVCLTHLSSLSLWFLKVQGFSAPTPGTEECSVWFPAFDNMLLCFPLNISQEESRTTFLETHRPLPSTQSLTQSLLLVREKTFSPANPTHFSWLRLWTTKDRKPSSCLCFLLCPTPNLRPGNCSFGQF